MQKKFKESKKKWYCENSRAVCPFYCKESKIQVVCEGLQKSQTLTIGFRNKTSMAKWQEKTCYNMDCLKNCPLAGLLMKKYEGEYNGAD